MEQEEIQSKLNLYTEVFNEARKKVGDEAAIAVVGEIGKDLRVADMRGAIGQRNITMGAREELPATEKQVRFMKELGMAVPEGLTKSKASALLDEELGR